MFQSRPPFVTVLGHVDHGKTSLLDAVRKTNIAGKEVGGITQGIGASVVVTKSGKKITFVDTPGHAAFAKMRSRGAAVADIALLVVDASDGVKPQTEESLQLIKEAKIPFIVVLTKIDLPAADVEGVLGELQKLGVLFEGRGGNTPKIEVSAKNGKGIEELLEMISLLSEVSGTSADSLASLEAVVIETSKTKAGFLVSLVVRNGTLKAGDIIYTDGFACKVKGIFDYLGKPIAKVTPGEPGQILGFSRLPPVGSIITADKDLVTARGTIYKTKDKYEKIKKDELPVIIRAKNVGALEALQASFPAKVVIVNAAIGDVLESDVLLARSTGARIFAFESNVCASVSKLAEVEKVKIEKFDVIYELLDRIEEILESGKEEYAGRSEIIASFPFDGQKIAGCKVVQGKITKTDNLVLIRGEKEVGRMKAVSLKKQKQEISEAKAGEEFGLIFEPQLDFAIHDMIVSVTK